MKMKPGFPWIAAAAFVLVFLSGCKNERKEDQDMNTVVLEKAHDPHTYAAPEGARISHLSLDIETDFDQKIIRGSATYAINRNGADSIILDARNLNIKKVTLIPSGKEAAFSLGESTDYMGRPLFIPLDDKTDSIRIDYATNPDAAALQWLDPEQTAGKKQPFLFTQSQAILARTWIPVQDSPGIRFTYDAKVKVPEDLMALMSAENPTAKTEDGVYHFKMTQPVPAYLMALAVGDLEYRQVGEETGVYAEPELIEKSANEFAEMQDMLEKAEGLYGDYRWEVYDLIVLPPSFPFGGMENPRLTFATPTILAGDRSLTALVAHELAHSWSGNLVTNETWDDFWLNEGFTVYFERRIMEELYGRDYAEMLMQLGYQDLQHTLEDLKDNPEDTRLKLELEGRDPDEGLTDIAYEKGALFLTMLEEAVGREKFDAFLKQYFDEHAFKTMSTERFVQYMEKNLLNDDQELIDSLRIREWIYEPGLPDNHPMVESERFIAVDAFLNEYLKWDEGNPDLSKTEAWSTHEWLHFIRHLPDEMSEAQMGRLDKDFGFTKSGNSEIAFAWYMHAAHNQFKPAYPAMREFLVDVGRRKFLTPLYRELKESGQAELALDIYKVARPNYHSVSRNTMDELLGYEATQ